MILISWNCRGIGSRSKDAAIKSLITGQKCSFLGLVESKHKELQDFKVRLLWGHSDVEWDHVRAIEGSGGLVASWDKTKFEKVATRKRDRWILTKGIFKYCGFKCQILVVYAPNCRYELKILWDELIALRQEESDPLLVMGDFNEVRRVEERNGGSNCMESIKEFLEWNEDIRIDDVPLIGRRFTWARGKSRSRLDRFFMDQDWGFRFPEATLTALPNSIFDHTPILLSLDKQVRDSHPFRNLDTWFSHPGFLKMVKEQWKKLGNMPPTKKLKALH